MSAIATHLDDRSPGRGRVVESLVVVVALAAAFALQAFRPDADHLVVGVTLAIVAIVAWIAWHDARTLTIPDGAVIALAILAVSVRWRLSDDGAGATVLVMLIDGGLPGGMLLIFREIYYRRKGTDGLGLGDVKLAAAGGLLIGVEGFAWALFAASLLALLAVGILRVAGKASLATDKLAFGAVLAPALLAVWVATHLPLLLSFGG